MAGNAQRPVIAFDPIIGTVVHDNRGIEPCDGQTPMEFQQHLHRPKGFEERGVFKSGQGPLLLSWSQLRQGSSLAVVSHRSEDFGCVNGLVWWNDEIQILELPALQAPVQLECERRAFEGH